MRVSSIFPAAQVVTIVAVFIIAMPHGPAWAQVDSREGIALQNQIYQLRQEVLSLRDQIARGGGGGRSPPTTGNDMVAQLLTRVDGLDDQLRQLRGRIDELQNQMQRQNADFAKRVDDLAYQMNSRGGPEAAPGPGSGGGVQTPPPNQPRVRTPEVAMQEGNAALARRDYPSAEAAAREVVAVRTSPRAYDGQMLLAQALFGERRYSDSVLAYDDTYNRNKRGAHAQDALLGMANSLVGLGEKRAACGTLDKLHAEFPQARTDLRDGIAAANQRAGCRS